MQSHIFKGKKTQLSHVEVLGQVVRKFCIDKTVHLNLRPGHTHVRRVFFLPSLYCRFHSAAVTKPLQRDLIVVEVSSYTRKTVLVQPDFQVEHQPLAAF